MSVRSIEIKSGQKDYQVSFYNDMSQMMRNLLSSIEDARVVLDKNVFELYSTLFNQELVGRQFYLMEATEEEKTLTGAEKFLTWLQQTKATKKTELIAVGGGIIQDIVTFSASVYYRGLKWHLVPTTLLSMADSCIGAKSGLNLNEYKNQIGNFYSPASISICSGFTSTLKPQDVLSGQGEILKLALIDSLSQYEDYKKKMSTSLEDIQVLNELISQSLMTKKRIIEEDEYESDLRRVLNYGHTFGHAIESIVHHEVPHGVAVAYGIDIVNFIALKKGKMSETLYQNIHDFIFEKYPPFPKQVTAESLFEYAKKDKKVIGDTVNLALLDEEKGMFVDPQTFNGDLKGWLNDYLA